jgi:hypothetical protein
MGEMRLRAFFLVFLGAVGNAFALPPCPELWRQAPHGPLALPAPRRALSLDEVEDYDRIIEGQRTFERAETNGMGKGVIFREQEEFLQTLDVAQVFEQVPRRFYDRVSGGRAQYDTYPSNLVDDYPSLRRDLMTPLLDTREITARQGAVRELLENPEMREQLLKWRGLNERFLTGDAQDSLSNFYGGALESLGKIKGARSPNEALHARNGLIYTVDHLAELPNTFGELTQIFSRAQSQRFAQMQQKGLYFKNNLRLEGIIEELGEAGYVAGKKAADYSMEELEAFARIVDRAAAEPWLKGAQRFGEDAVRYSVLSDVAVAHGWRNFAEAVPAQGDDIFFRMEDAHNPRVLREKGAAGSQPNDIALGGSEPRGMILTGANARGKSTTERTAGQLMILSQMGLPVPAKGMKFTPMRMYVHKNPPDSPSQGLSQFVTQAADLRRFVMSRVDADPRQLIILDEILPGSMALVRTAAEKVFLKKLAAKKPLIVVASHNWSQKADAGGAIVGTPRLADEIPGAFKNVHVTPDFKLVDGAETDSSAMFVGAAEALRKAEWPRDWVQDFLETAGFSPEQIRAYEAAHPY